MSFSSLNCTQEFVLVMTIFYGMVPLALLILAQTFFFVNARPDEEGQATSPLESLFDSPQLSVSRKFKAIAQQNTPCSLY